MSLEVICIGALTVYADGYNQSFFSVSAVQGGLYKYTYVLRSSANLIGIQCLNSYGNGSAIIARTDTSLVSDRSWKVAVGITDPDWTTACYDDSQWLNSISISELTWPQMTGATWITYPGGSPSNSAVYYRGLIRK